MTLPIKLATGILGTAITTIGSISGYELLRTKNVEDHLSKSGNTILNIETKYESAKEQEEDYKSWKEITEKHKESDSDIKSFANWGEGTSIQEYEKINKLKDACKSALSILETDTNFSNKLQNAKKFCIKQAT